MRISKVDVGTILEFGHMDRAHDCHVMQITGPEEMKIAETLAKYAGCPDDILSYLRTCFAITVIARSTGQVPAPITKSVLGPVLRGHVLMRT